MTNISAGKWVFDSHLFVYSQDIKSPFYKVTSHLFSRVLSGEIEIVCAQQNIIETENVLIRFYQKDSSKIVNILEDILLNYNIDVITPDPKTYEHYHDLIIKSKQPYDLYDYFLAATMLDNGIDRILTGNTKDFTQIPGIEAVNPFKA